MRAVTEQHLARVRRIRGDLLDQDGTGFEGECAEDAAALAALLAEREALIDALQEDRDKWRFDTLLVAADALLARAYPDDVFPDLDDPQVEGDPGPALVRALRRCRAALNSEKD